MASIDDPIPALTGWARKAVTVKTVSYGLHRGAMTQEDYVRRMSAFQREAAGTRDMAIKTSAFWKMENLSSEFLKHRRTGQSLRDPALPTEIRPISHCGMGIAAVEVGGFDPRGISDVIEAFSSPEYRLFAYEGSGAMLAVYEQDLFGLMSKASAAMGILPLARLRKPDTRTFLGGFDGETRRLMAHGYGRLKYFKNHTIGSAIEAVLRAEEFEPHPCVQGIAFAYAMVNNRDLHRVFLAGERMADAGLRAAFTDGLTYALEFWEWMAPGFLDQFEARTGYERDLARAARAEVESDRRRGPMAAFAVGSRRLLQ